MTVQWIDAVRVWLVDLPGVAAPAAAPARLVASWSVPDRARFLGPDEHWSASADGRLLLVSAPVATGRIGLHLVRAETGDVTLLREDAQADLLSPRLTPDGRRYAFARVRLKADGAEDDGIWTGEVGTREVTRVVEPARPPESVLPAAWSGDGRWLAYRRHALGGGSVHVVAAAGGPSRQAGAGRGIDWRAREPRLVTADSATPAGGGQSALRTYDVAASKVATLYGPTDTLLARPRWHPTQDRILYLESTGPWYTGSLLRAWTRDLAGNATAQGAAEAYVDVWWSADGSRIYALAGADDSVWGIVDVATGKAIAFVCVRGDAPPCP